jgi:hypothetical protein
MITPVNARLHIAAVCRSMVDDSVGEFYKFLDWGYFRAGLWQEYRILAEAVIDRDLRDLLSVFKGIY